MRLLLDSHTLLWSLYEPEKLPARVEDLVADLSNQLVVSHVTVLELANKATALRLPLAGPSPERLLERVVQLGPTFYRSACPIFWPQPICRSTTPTRLTGY